MLGEIVTLHSYKHDKTLHRVWKSETFLDENDEYIIVANKRTKVIESNGRFWYTREPSVSVFFKNHWYNVICIYKNTGIFFYCNLSSPILQDDEALKYIDYDLDIKVDENYNLHVLDVNEYNRNKETMNYPEDIKNILQLEMEDLKKRIESRAFPFDKVRITELYNKYQDFESRK